MIDWRIGDNLEHLADMQAAGETVDLVATSPPFLGLRDYGGLEGQHGAETSPAGWLATQLDVIEACGRVLADHGSIAWEVGDPYSGSGGAGGDYNTDGMREGQRKAAGSAKAARQNRGGWPLPKSLCGTPQALMVSLAYGRNILALPGQPEWREFDPWIVRNSIAWVRTSPPAGALADKWRPATSQIIVATRSPTRFWDPVSTLVPSSVNTTKRTVIRSSTDKAASDGRGGNWSSLASYMPTNAGVPLLDWWQVNNPGTAEPHYAVWPSEIVARLIKAMCPQRVCTVCGEPSRRALAEDEGWLICGHNDWRPGRVLDPYAGSGTTLAVADWLGRDATGIDLNPRNRDEIWPNRQHEAVRQLLGAPPVTTLPGQLDMFANT